LNRRAAALGGSGSGAGSGSWPSARAGWYATFILTLAYTFSFVDRQVLNLLVDPIRNDLGVSDTQISFLQGLGFVIPYVLMSVPVGRLVDTYDRVKVLAGGVALWSLTTFSCGLASSYTTLLAARMGVGAGEASVTPAAWSLLPDYFPPDKLATPVSVYLMGPYLGGGLALVGGAYVIDWVGNGQVELPLVGAVASWQFTFMMAALPGALIILLLTTMPRVTRRLSVTTAEQTPEQNKAPGLRAVMAFMRSEARIYFAVLVGVPFMVVILYGLQAWVPTTLVRVFGWDLASAGKTYGVIALLAGSLGVLSGPIIGKRLAARGHSDYPLLIGVWAAGAVMVAMGALFWQTTGTGVLVCVALASYFVTLPLALMAYVIQIVTPANMRGVMSGVYVVANNVLGLGLGPTLVAVTTDYVFQDANSVHLSLACVSVLVAPLAMTLLASGRRSLRRYAGSVK